MNSIMPEHEMFVLKHALDLVGAQSLHLSTNVLFSTMKFRAQAQNNLHLSRKTKFQPFWCTL